MKKALIAVSAFLMLSLGARADEGMWLLPLLQKMNSKAMENIGCRLTPEQIYDINHNSLKDAIVQFGGGCTGEIISDKGLLVTNHIADTEASRNSVLLSTTIWKTVTGQ